MLAACQISFLDNWLTEEESVQIDQLTMFSWVSTDAEATRLQELVTEFNENFPAANVALQFTEDYERDLQAALGSATPPDLFLLDGFSVPELYATDGLRTISLPDETQADLYPWLRSAFSVDNSLYCVPREVRTLALIYNTSLFDAAQQPYPDQTWSWEDLRAAAEAITASTNPFYTTYGMVLSADFARWLPFLHQAGGRVIDEEQAAMAINDAQGQQALAFYLGLLLDGYAVTPADLNSGWNGEAFGKGRVGMTIEGNWIVPYLAQEFPELGYGIAPLPTGPQKRATTAFVTCYALSARSRHPDSAQQLIIYLTRAESMRNWLPLASNMPARVSLQDEWLASHPAQKAFVDGLEYAHVWQFGPGFRNVIDVINSSMQQVLDADVLPEEVLRVAETVGNEALTRMR